MSCLNLAILVLLFLTVFDAVHAGVGSVNLAGVRQIIQGYGASSAWQGAVSDAAMNSL